MRRILTGFAVAAAVAAIATLALAGNQEVADQIAQELRASGQMSGYKIGVKCQNGTVWLRGSVANEEQMNAALKLAFQTPGVARVVNELNVGPAAADQPAPREASQPSSQADAGERSAQAAICGPQPASRPGPHPVDAEPAAAAERRPGEAAGNGHCSRPRPEAGRSRRAGAQFVPCRAGCADIRAGGGAAADGAAAACQADGNELRGDAGLPARTEGVQRRADAHVHGGCWRRGRSPGPLRPALPAQLCLAKLCGLPQLRRCDLSQAVFAHGLALHRPILPLSASSVGMAEGDPGMGRWMVVPRLQGSAGELLAPVGSGKAINCPRNRSPHPDSPVWGLFVAFLVTTGKTRKFVTV